MVTKLIGLFNPRWYTSGENASHQAAILGASMLRDHYATWNDPGLPQGTETDTAAHIALLTPENHE